jgi:N-glycosylase/DNA lyase
MITTLNIEKTVLRIYDRLENSFRHANETVKNDNELWQELVFSLLSSRVKYEHAKATYDYLLSQTVVNEPKEFIFNSGSIYIIESILKTPVNFAWNNKNYLMPFPFSKQRSEYIFQTAQNIYSDSSLTEILKSYSSANETRKKLIYLCKGLGPKQASMYLNNINYSYNFAVLDTHILTYLYIMKIIKEKMKSISSLNNYEVLEEKFNNYAKDFQLNIRKLDMSIWIVMRTLKRNFSDEYRNISFRWT